MQREQTSVPKMMLYLLLCLLLYVVQTSVLRAFPLGGYHLDLLPAFVASAAMLGGPVEGLVAGLAAGTFYDLGFAGIDGLYPIYFLLFGLTAGALCRLVLSRSYLSLVLLNAFEMISIGFLRYFCYLLPQKGASFGLVFQQIMGSTLLACVFCFVPYLPMRTLSRKLDIR